MDVSTECGSYSRTGSWLARMAVRPAVLTELPTETRQSDIQGTFGLANFYLVVGRGGGSIAC